jgi:hypothetical protein
MIYTEDERESLEIETKTETKDNDINPTEYFSNSKVNSEKVDNEEDEEIEDSFTIQKNESNGTEYSSENSWSLRKCCASSLDYLSFIFSKNILKILLPLIENNLKENNEWYVIEAALLALGAVADG